MKQPAQSQKAELEPSSEQTLKPVLLSLWGNKVEQISHIPQKQDLWFAQHTEVPWETLAHHSMAKKERHTAKSPSGYIPLKDTTGTWG